MLLRLVMLLSLLVAPSAWADESVVPARALLIMHAEHLAEAAGEWSAYRQSTGWAATTLAVAPGANNESRAAQLVTAIDNAWGDALADGADEFCVLLLGDADAEGIPTFRFHQHDPDLVHHLDTHYISDHPFRAGDITRDQPHFALGRIPARTLDEARTILNKIKAYEASSTRPAPWQRRINCLAGEGHFGPLDMLLETVFTRMVDTLVPPTFNLSMTYSKSTSIYCPPVSELTHTILRRLGEDSFLFFYVGHGAPTSLDDFYWQSKRHDTLRAADLMHLDAPGPFRPIAVMACCSVGWFDLPEGRHSLAEAMLFAPTGPIAVFAGSRPTHPYANAVMLEAFTRHATSGEASTLGEISLLVTRDMLRAPSARDPIDLISTPIARTMQWASSLREHRRMHVRLYNLLGDPCLALPPPSSDITFERRDRMILGSIPAMQSGQVAITIESSRHDPAHVDRLHRIDGPDDPELPDKSANNYPIANDRTLFETSVVVRAGVFEFVLPDVFSPRAVIITFHAFGRDEHDHPVAAHSALSAREWARPESTQGDQ